MFSINLVEVMFFVPHFILILFLSFYSIHCFYVLIFFILHRYTSPFVPCGRRYKMLIDRLVEVFYTDDFTHKTVIHKNLVATATDKRIDDFAYENAIKSLSLYLIIQVVTFLRLLP